MMAARMNGIHDKSKGRSRGRKWAGRSLWTLAILGVGIAVLEFSLRRMGYTQRAAMYYDQDVGFRSWPNQTRWQLGADMQPTVQMRLNGLGFRGPLLPQAKDPDKQRIVTLGDSFNFGLGVEDHETYPVFLQAQLEATDPGAFEVMDVSYPGWAPKNEAAAYREIIRDFQPDVVVLGFTFNDLQPPDGGMRYTDGPFFRWFGTSAIAWAITTKWLNKLPNFVIQHDEATNELLAEYFAAGNGIAFAAAEEQAAPYWGLVEPALISLRDEVNRDGGQLLVAYFPALAQLERLYTMRDDGTLEDPAVRSQACQLQEELARRCAALDIEFLDCTDAFLNAEENPFGGIDPGHPSPNGLRVMAREVARAVRKLTGSHVGGE